MNQPRRHVAIVTDSTACLGPRREGIDVLPLMVAIGAEQVPEIGESTTAQVLAALRAGERVTTSQPPPAAFDAAYQRAADVGASEVLSIHLSAGLSGTFAAARAAAARAPIAVHPIDSGTTGRALGTAVLGAAALAREGRDALSIREDLAARFAATSLMIAVDSLDYLQRGGRLGEIGTGGSGSAAGGGRGGVGGDGVGGDGVGSNGVGGGGEVGGGGVGSPGGLPVLTMAGGRLVPAGLAPDFAAALNLVVEASAGAVAACPSALATVHYGADANLAAEMADRIAERCGSALTGTDTAPVGAVLAAHTGPGVIAIAVAPAP